MHACTRNHAEVPDHNTAEIAINGVKRCPGGWSKFTFVHVMSSMRFTRKICNDCLALSNPESHLQLKTLKCHLAVMSSIALRTPIDSKVSWQWQGRLASLLLDMLRQIGKA